MRFYSFALHTEPSGLTYHCPAAPGSRNSFKLRRVYIPFSFMLSATKLRRRVSMPVPFRPYASPSPGFLSTGSKGSSSSSTSSLSSRSPTSLVERSFRWNFDVSLIGAPADRVVARQSDPTRNRVSHLRRIQTRGCLFSTVAFPFFRSGTRRTL